MLLLITPFILISICLTYCSAPMLVELSSSQCRHFSLNFPLVVQSLSCGWLCNPMDCITPGFCPSPFLMSLLKLMSIESVMPSNHLILCHPLLLLPSVFPSTGVFTLRIAFAASHEFWCCDFVFVYLKILSDFHFDFFFDSLVVQEWVI